jgi:23S rRNA pseudouridine1911/1915/1917 synthase
VWPVTVISAGQSPRRLDVFVSTQRADLSRAVAQRWIAGGIITVNGRRAKAAQKVRSGDVVACHAAVRDPLPVRPEAIALDILHEDAALLVVNKPPGLVMHPAPGHWTGTLLNALVHHVGRHGDGTADDRERPGLVHRLDKGTSGVLAIAKTDAAHRALSRQFHAHSVHRIYVALVAGQVRRGGMIDLPIGRDTRDARRVSARSSAPRRAVTEYRVAEALGSAATLLDVRPRTGRMHQIRVHLASIGHPVLGDETYGTADSALDRPLLHAAVLGFVHPVTRQYVEHRAPLPDDMARAVAARRAPAVPVISA